MYCAQYLYEKGISGYFFPSINGINGKLMDVNKIHLIIGNRSVKPKNILKLLKDSFTINKDEKDSVKNNEF